MQWRRDFCYLDGIWEFHSLSRPEISTSSSPGNALVIQARNLTRIYPLGDGSVIGINQLNLEVSAGDLVVLKGNSGSGKSTLLSLLAGLDHPTSGELVVAGHRLSNSSAVDLTRFRREVVGVVFQT